MNFAPLFSYTSESELHFRATGEFLVPVEYIIPECIFDTPEEARASCPSLCIVEVELLDVIAHPSPFPKVIPVRPLRIVE